jgi:microcystin-dependent protein
MYLGKSPASNGGVRAIYEYSTSNNQLSISGFDSSGSILSYDPGFINVYVNGALIPKSSYSALNGTSIDFSSAFPIGTSVIVEVFGSFRLANMLPLSGGTASGYLSTPTPPPGDVSQKLATTEFVNSKLNSVGLIGSIVYVATSTAPTGYLKANGAAVSRTTYSALFATIGTTFGAGDGSTTFNLPDLRGEFLRGWDDSRGVDGGRTFGSAQVASVETHSHSTDGTNGSNPHAVYNGSDGNFDYGRSGSSSAADADYKEGTKTGTYGASETRPRNIALLACIKF